jgi:hypothetical protein
VSCESTIGILDPPIAFEEPTEFEGSEVDVPHAIVDVLEADICPGTGDGDVDPWIVPPYATIGADVAHLEAVGRLERWQLVGHLPWGGFISGGGCVPVKRLMRTLVVERFTEAIELLLRCAKVCPGWSGGVGFQGAMHALVAAVLWLCAGCEALG